MPDLLILSATSLEVADILNRYPQTSQKKIRSGHPVFSGMIGSSSYDLLITGPGVLNTACVLAAYLESIPENALKLIVQLGIAGLFKGAGLVLGDLAVATSERYIHTGVESKGLKLDPLPFELILKHPLTCKGVYLFHENHVDHFYQKLSSSLVFRDVSIGKGPFITVSSITASFGTAKKIGQSFSCVMEAMEGAAAAHVAAIYNIPMLEIRSASNMAGERDKEKWQTDMAVARLGLVCQCLFDG
jgi:futalosine hydrolase